MNVIMSHEKHAQVGQFDPETKNNNNGQFNKHTDCTILGLRAGQNFQNKVPYPANSECAMVFD